MVGYIMGTESAANNERSVLESGLKELGLESSTDLIETMVTYVDELDRWNRVFGFMRADRARLVTHHILDSMAGLGTIRGLRRHSRIIDIGTGTGFPGIPLALGMNSSTITLVDRSARKVAFLRSVMVKLGLKNVRIMEAEIESVVGPFDVVVFRALAPLAGAIGPAAGLLGEDSTAVAYKGTKARIEAELPDLLQRYTVSVLPVEVPFISEERHLVLIRRRL